MGDGRGGGMLLGLRVVLGMSGGFEKKFGYIIDWSRGPWDMIFRRMGTVP